MTSPADLSLVELLPLLHDRSLSARELLEDCLARVARHEPVVQAFTTLTPELARASAVRADEDRAAGRPVGALAGVPVALKDLYLTAGVPTTASSRVLEGHDPGVDAMAWQRLQRAGAGLLGKTVLHEFAYGTGSHPTANPWDPTRTPGGSSGGSGAALAARMVPAALGTDTGGSLRIPAALCGVTSLRPAPGRVPSEGVLPLAPSLDVAGPMARRLRDVVLLLRVLAAEEAAPADPPDDLRGVRIGLPTRGGWEDLDPSVEQVCRTGLQLLVDRGAELVEVDPPAGTDEVLAVPGTYGHVVHAEALLVHERWLAERADRYGEDVRGRLATARSTTPGQLSRAREQAVRWRADWRELMGVHRLVAVASPTVPQPAPPRGQVPSLALCKGWSVAGFPALSVPAGRDVRGLPVGLQLAALPEREASLLGLGLVVDETVALWRQNPLAPA